MTREEIIQWIRDSIKASREARIGPRVPYITAADLEMWLEVFNGRNG